MLDVLYEDNHLLAVNKPAMLPTMGVAADRPSLLAEAKEYIRRKYDKPGQVYLGIVSRLDAPVTGVVLMARTSKAAARLTRLFRERDVVKTYLALVEGPVDPPSGKLVHFLRKDERHRRMHVCSQAAAGAQRAELTYQVRIPNPQSGNQGEDATPHRSLPPCLPVSLTLSAFPRSTLVEVQLLTGRKHQIRVQLADAFAPLVGDRKYGGRRPFPAGIALHAWRLRLEHPVRKLPLVIEAPLPPAWGEFAGQPTDS